MVDGIDVENAILVQSDAHCEAIERQCLHTAVSFNSARFLW